MSSHLSGLSAGQALQTLVVPDSGGQVLLNGRVVRIGYLTQGPAVTLCEQLAAILRGG